MNPPRLLILELWGLGDLAIASPFIKAASERYEVTLLAKPYARDLQPRLWPKVKVVEFTAPWSAFKGKYRLHRWPWRNLTGTLRQLRRQGFDVAVSGRWDPRDHAWMWLTGAKKRYGFPRSGSQYLLHHPLSRPNELAHRYEQWRQLGQALELPLPDISAPSPQASRIDHGPIRRIVVHTGAAQAVRVWPLDRYARLIDYLQSRQIEVSLICDPPQADWWRDKGYPTHIPTSVADLAEHLGAADAFIGNDSGPGHLAAALDVPTLSIFGPQKTEWFRPVHPSGMVVEGKDCPYKPCFDSCRYESPHCLLNVEYDEVQHQTELFLGQWEEGAPSGAASMG